MTITSEEAYFLALPNSVENAELLKAYSLLGNDKFDSAIEILEDLARRDNAAALYLLSGVSCPPESIEKFEARHIQQLQKAADLGFPPALHKLAVYSDTGEYVEKNIKKAAQLFKSAAEKGYPHSQWIYGEDLLYGRNGIVKNERLGLIYIQRAVEAKFEGALETLANIYENGEFGYSKDKDHAALIRKQIKDGDTVGF